MIAFDHIGKKRWSQFPLAVCEIFNCRPLCNENPAFIKSIATLSILAFNWLFFEGNL